MIPEETIEKVLASTDILGLVSSYFPMKRVGTDYMALCPFHAEKSPSFSVSPSRQLYYCFGCGAGGNATRFLMDYENIDFPTAVRRLAEKAGIPIVEEAQDEESSARKKIRQKLLNLHRDAAEWFHALLLKKDVAEGAREYLKARGLGIDTARLWKLGYAPAHSQMFLQWAREKGHDSRLLTLAGLASQGEDGGGLYARFRDRLMFPVCNDYGEVIAFSGRILQADAAAAKYMNSPETPLFEKSKTLFGLHMSKRPILREGRAIICEGQIDLITCQAHGIENVVAPLGTAFTAEHARLLKRQTEEVVLCFDADNAGFKAAERTFRVLMAANVFVRAVLMPAGEDPDSFIGAKGAEEFRALISQAPDFLEFQIAHRSQTLSVASSKDQRQLAMEVAENVALVSDKLMQDTMINAASARLRLAPEQFRRAVVEASRRQKKEQARPQEKPEPEAPAFAFQDPLASQLCQAVLIHAEAKAWWRSILSYCRFIRNHPDASVLSRLAEASFDPGQPSSTGAFLSSLPQGEQRALTALIARPPQGDHLKAAQDFVLRMEQDSLRNLLQSLESRLRDPALPVSELETLLQEILAMKETLDRLRSPQNIGEVSHKTP